jgi:hypothetical protein
MASLRQQKKAQLVKNRNNLMDMVFDAKMKRANEVRVIKEFASVVTFLDHEDDLPVLDKPTVKKQVVAKTKTQSKEMVPPVVKKVVEKRLQSTVANSAVIKAEEEVVEVVSSGYWDKKFN